MTMQIDRIEQVVVAYPSGNTTAIIFDQLMDCDRKALNEAVMKAWTARSSDQPEVEQCCFVALPRNPDAIARVEMFGGEYCANAARSVAWIVTKGRDYEGLIEVSGVEQPLSCSVRNGEVALEMPIPVNKELVRLVSEGVLVQLDGITQLVVTNLRDRQTPRRLLTDLLKANKYGLFEQLAVGVSYFDQTTNKAEFCVWVREVDTIFDETACGSGTSAIGVALAIEMSQSVSLSVLQPSGDPIRTEAKYVDGAVTQSSIAGRVAILYDGELKLS